MKAQRKNIEIKNPDNPMTNKQSYKLMMVTGVTLYYMESYPYTIQEASDLIDQALNGKAYHIRVELAQHEGSKVSWEDVGKDYRNDTKPKGYKQAMTMLGEEEEVEEEEAEEDEIAILKARLAELEKPKPKPQPQGTTKAQKRAALQRKFEGKLKKHTKQNPEPPPAKKDKSSDDNGQAKKDAVIAMLAEQSGLDIDRIKQLQKAFNAIA